MTITDVKIRRVFENPEAKVKAIVSIVVDDEFAIHDLKIVDGVERLFVAMPNRRSESRNFQDIAHPISKEARSKIEEAVLNEYYAVINQKSCSDFRVG